MVPIRPNWPAGLPSPGTLQAATDALCRLYVLPATMLHTLVASQALELAYLLSAFGMAPAEPDAAADTARKPPRGTGFRNRRRRAGRQDVAVDALN
jgi:hypothetical protein